MDNIKRNTIVKVITELHMPYPSDRKKTRIIEDGNGVWRVQSFVSSKELPNAETLPPEIWRDECYLDEEYPREYSSYVMNLSSLLKDSFNSGYENAKIGIPNDNCGI